MRGATSMVAGLGLMALALWAFSAGGTGIGLALAGGATALFVRGFRGHSVTEAGGVAGPMEFIRDPAGAIVDSAVDKLGEFLAGKDETQSEEKPFNPDEAMERYLANRPASPDAAAPPPIYRGFGRKGLGNGSADAAQG